jgi:hypothetical protein
MQCGDGLGVRDGYDDVGGDGAANEPVNGDVGLRSGGG